MLPSLTQPILSPASAAAAAAEPVLSTVAQRREGAARAGTAHAVSTALSISDSLVGYAAPGGVLSAPARRAAPARSARAIAAQAGYAQGAIATASSAKSTPAASMASASAKKSGPLAFLDDSKLSVEDKLMRLLAYLNDKWDKDIDKKMKEIGAGAGATGSATSSSGSASASKAKEKSGFLGSIVKAANEFFPGVGIAVEALANPAVRALATKLGGPVLAAAATALGFPELAPALLKYGPQVVDLAAGAASALVDGEGVAVPASGGASTSAASDGAATSDRKVQQRLMEIQRTIDQQKEMFSLVSNMLRSTHETRMAVIQNVR